MIEITKDTIIGDILDVAPQTAPIFLSIGMHCLGCPSSRGETVEEACAVHGIDVDKLLALVNEEAKHYVKAGMTERPVTVICKQERIRPVRMRLSVLSGEPMKHLQLQPRLRLLADMVPQGARLADIGTDHGYLPVWLMQQGRIASAIAADIGPEPLAHARRTA